MLLHSIPGRQVGTVGKIQSFPGAFNVIPGRVLNELGTPRLGLSESGNAVRKNQVEVRRIETETGTKFDFKQVNGSKPALTDTRFRQMIEAAAKELGLYNQADAKRCGSRCTGDR